MMDEIQRQTLEKLSQIRQILEMTPGSPYSPGQTGTSIYKKHSVGIISVEVMEPGWLKNALNSMFFNESVMKSKYAIYKDNKIKEVFLESTVCIFLADPFMWNNTSIEEKYEELRKFGGKPLIIVMDDVEDSGDAKKKKLLNDLINYKIYIKDLFLFSKLEKNCDFMKYLKGGQQTHSMPSGKGVDISAPPNQHRHVNSNNAAHIAGVDTLPPLRPPPNQQRHVNSYHPAHMMDPLQPTPMIPNKNRHGNTSNDANMMGEYALVPVPAIPEKDSHVHSYHPAKTVGSDLLVSTSSTSFHDRYINPSCPQQMAGSDLLVSTSSTSFHDRYINPSCPQQMAEADLYSSIPSNPRQERRAETSSSVNVIGKDNNQDPPVPDSSTPNQHTSVYTPHPKDTMGSSYNEELNTNISSQQQEGKKHSIGIFSRSSSEDYSWLMAGLTSEYFRDNIQDVKPCYIFNNGFKHFIDVLSQCTFGILYHTKNRGRLNVTDVTDSLYDEELNDLNLMLGRDNVIVLIDDVDDSSDQAKTRIKKDQPSIEKLASHLLLISQTEKVDRTKLLQKLQEIKLFLQ